MAGPSRPRALKDGDTLDLRRCLTTATAGNVQKTRPPGSVSGGVSRGHPRLAVDLRVPKL
jgi:hypothetical protein